MKNKRSKNAHAEKCIKQELDKLFQGVKHEIAFGGPCKYRCVMITYQDFKPVPELEKKIRDITGGWVKPVVKREYSEEFIKEVMYETFQDNGFYIIQEDKRFNVLYPQRFREFIRDILKNKKAPS